MRFIVARSMTNDSFLKLVVSCLAAVQTVSVFLSMASGKVQIITTSIIESTIDLPFARISPKTTTVRKKQDTRVLVVAAVPRDERHVYTLWSELECFSANVDHVVVSAPTWSRSITEKITDLARTSIPKFSSGLVTLETQYHVNDRYDVGLWCDALKAINLDAFDEFGIVNDSVFALREYSGIFDSLKERNISMSSLSYSHTAKFFKGYGPEYFWVESVFRGLTKEGLKTFMEYSCVDANHPRFCPDGNKRKRKECVILFFEQDMAAQFPRDRVDGLFFSDVPSNMKEAGRFKDSHTWALHVPYWRKLVHEMQFPAAKANVKGVIDDLNDPLLGNCTRYVTRTLIDEMKLDFSVVQSGLQPIAKGAIPE